MKTAIMVACAITIIVLAGGVTLQFKPFKIAFPDWRLLVAVFFFMLAVAFFRYHYMLIDREKAFFEGVEMTIKRAEEVLGVHIEKDEVKRPVPEREAHGRTDLLDDEVFFRDVSEYHE
jgi:hypothetical protein